MQKTALATAVSLAISPPLFAADLSFYAGGSLLNTKLENKYQQIPTPLLPNDNRVFESDDSATALKLFGGTRWRLSKGFYGLEVAYEDGQSESTAVLFPMTSPMGPKAELKDDSSFSLSFMGGYEFYQNTFLTGRVGYISTKFDYKVYEEFATSRVTDSGDDTLSAVQFAVGVEHNFTDSFGMRVEYSKADYSDSIGPVKADRSTGALAIFDDISRDAISIGIFMNF